MKKRKKKKSSKPAGQEKLVESEVGLDTSGVRSPESNGDIKYEEKVEDDEADLLEFDGIKASTTAPAESEPEPESEPVIPAQPQLQLAPAPTIDAKTFQGRWVKLQGQTINLTLSEPGVGPAKAMEPLLQQQRVNVMASGTLPSTMKYFFYAQDLKGAYFLIESLADLNTGVCKTTIKADTPNDLPAFIDYLKFALAPILKS